MKLYPDANIFYGFFKGLVSSWRKRQKFEMPELIKFLKRNDFKIFASILTKCEIARRLKLEYKLSDDDIERMWNYLEKFLDIKLVEEVIINYELYNIVKKFAFRSKINNIIHLYLCKELGLVFLTGDKKIMEDGKAIYEKITDYVTLRKRYI